MIIYYHGTCIAQIVIKWYARSHNMWTHANATSPTKMMFVLHECTVKCKSLWTHENTFMITSPVKNASGIESFAKFANFHIAYLIFYMIIWRYTRHLLNLWNRLGRMLGRLGRWKSYVCFTRKPHPMFFDDSRIVFLHVNKTFGLLPNISSLHMMALCTVRSPNILSFDI